MATYKSEINIKTASGTYDTILPRTTYDMVETSDGSKLSDVRINGKELKGEIQIQGKTGSAGVDGRQIELRKTQTHIEWKYMNELSPLADFTSTKTVVPVFHDDMIDTLRLTGIPKGTKYAQIKTVTISGVNASGEPVANINPSVTAPSGTKFEYLSGFDPTNGVIDITNNQEISGDMLINEVINNSVSQFPSGLNVVGIDKIMLWVYALDSNKSELAQTYVTFDIKKTTTGMDDSWKTLISLDELKGEKGNSATIKVGSVVTGEAGTEVIITNSGTENDAVFNFTIPRGEQGIQGVQGQQGIQGVKGENGRTSTITVGTVTTGEPESSVSITNVGTSTDAIFDFTIPRGKEGKTIVPNITANATTLPAGSNVTVEKSGTNTDVAFTFGIPKGDKGEQGLQGNQGEQGVAGKSAYQSAQSAGFSGSESQFNTALADVEKKITKPDSATDGQVLTYRNNNWIAENQTGGVTSFNGRTGAVNPQDGDYTAEQVGAIPKVNGNLGQVLGFTGTNIIGAIDNPVSKIIAGDGIGIVDNTISAKLSADSGNGLKFGEDKGLYVSSTGGGGKKYARTVIGSSTSGYTEKDVDYLCDGVDDQVEIQNAINQTSDQIVILDGTYNLSSGIVISNSYSQITGNGERTELRCDPSISIVFELKNNSLFELKNLNIIGGSGSSEAVSFRNSQNATIENVIIQNFVFGVYTYTKMKNITISGCNFNNVNNPIIFAKGAEKSKVMYNNIRSSSGGIYLYEGSLDNIILGNFLDLQYAGNYGVHIERGSKNNIIIDNNITSAKDTGINLYAGDCSNNIISNNICANCSTGISTGGYSGNVDNIVIGNTVINSQQNSIYVYGKNLISSNYVKGKEVTVAGEGSVVVNNVS